MSVPASIQHTAGANYSAELASRDPGGSMFCPSASAAQRVTAAYAVTYSSTGQPMTSDEQRFINRRVRMSRNSALRRLSLPIHVPGSAGLLAGLVGFQNP